MVIRGDGIKPFSPSLHLKHKKAPENISNEYKHNSMT